jgi:hypothetical protein
MGNNEKSRKFGYFPVPKGRNRIFYGDKDYKYHDFPSKIQIINTKLN